MNTLPSDERLVFILCIVRADETSFINYWALLSKLGGAFIRRQRRRNDMRNDILANINYYLSYYGYTPREIYEKSGMGRNKWYARKKKPDDFTIGELKAIAKVIGIKWERFLERRI